MYCLLITKTQRKDFYTFYVLKRNYDNFELTEDNNTTLRFSNIMKIGLNLCVKKIFVRNKNLTLPSNEMLKERS